MSSTPRTRGAPPRLALLALVCLAFGAWLSVPRERSATSRTRPALHAVLIDASASATRARAGWARFVRERLVEECDRADREGLELAVVRYAADVVVDFGPAPTAEFRAWLEGRGREPYPAPLARDRQSASELARALQVALELLDDPERPPGSLCILSDGTFTGSDPRAALDALARVALRFERDEYPLPDRADLALDELRAAPRLEPGAPLVAQVSAAFVPVGQDAPASAALFLELESEGELVASTRRSCALPGPSAALDGSRRRTFGERLVLPAPAPGLYTLRARIEFDRASGADPVPENDALACEVTVGDPLVCVLLAPEERRAALRDLLREPAFDGIAVRATTFLELEPDLARADLLVTESIGPTQLPRAALRDFVERGGGWLALGGYGALRGWTGGDDASVAACLPLLPPDPDARERELLLFVDGSGSMTGDPFERVKGAVFQLVLGARPGDRFQLRFFTGAMGPIVFQTHGARPEDLRRDLMPLFAAQVPRGPTDVLYALDQLAAQRETSPYPGLVLLITDGRTLDWQAARSSAVRARLAASSTDLAVIAVGAALDREFLESLLLPGESLDVALGAGEARAEPDSEQLLSIFERRVNADRLDERAGRSALALDPDALAALAGVGADVLRAQRSLPGVERGRLGDLARSLRARLRPGAELLWRTDDGAPLLALQRVGAGLVAAVATTPLEDWSPFLAERPGLLAPLLRALGRGGEHASGMRLGQVDGELLLERVAPGTAPVVEARFLSRRRGASAARVLSALDPERALGVEERELGRVALTLPPTGNGGDPRGLRRAARPAFLDRAAPGEALAVDLASAGRALGRVFFVPAAAAEFSTADERRVPWPEDPGAAPSDRSGPPGGPPDGDGASSSRRAHPAAPWLLGLALLLGTAAAWRSPVKESRGSPERDRMGGARSPLASQKKR